MRRGRYRVPACFVAPWVTDAVRTAPPRCHIGMESRRFAGRRGTTGDEPARQGRRGRILG